MRSIKRCEVVEKFCYKNLEYQIFPLAMFTTCLLHNDLYLFFSQSSKHLKCDQSLTSQSPEPGVIGKSSASSISMHDYYKKRLVFHLSHYSFRRRDCAENYSSSPSSEVIDSTIRVPLLPNRSPTVPFDSRS